MISSTASGGNAKAVDAGLTRARSRSRSTQAIRRTQIRFRIFPLASCFLLLVGLVLFFAVGRAFSALVAVAFLLASWSMFGRPFYRSRYRRALSKNLPTWNIKAD